MNSSELEAIGLTKNQSAVYLSLLKLGSAGALGIIKESGLQSSRVYDSLEKLENFGLVSYVIRDFKKYFQAAPPEKLVDFLKEKIAMINKIIPDLKKIEGMKKEELHASVYKGKEGIKTIHSMMLKEGKDVYLIGAKGMIFSELPYFTPHFEKERLKRRIKFHLIYDNKKVKEYEQKTVKRQFFEGKSLPKGFGSKSVVNIFGSKVAIVSWNEEYPTALMIDDKNVADSFKKWFDFMHLKCK
ncbi:hypothetical protein J4401_04910 [Candidatus Woesearchaeota archaeon]|nr:hypothetical protein [Candidatus Woesearchaeota archaeon]